MTDRTVVLPGGRRLILGSVRSFVRDSIGRPFVVLVPAFNAGERRSVEEMVGILVDLGCVEFCCVGPEAELLHDSIDGIVEEKGALDVVTTWHENHADACEYFLLAAGGKPPALLALISSHSELAARLEEQMKGE